MRHQSRPLALLVGGSLALAAALSPRASGAQHTHASSARPAARPTAAAARNSCSTCLERGAILDPNLFSKGYEPEVKAAYEAASKYPDTLDRIHCFCECKESLREHHKTLLTCFTNTHGAGCGICQHEALLAAKLKDRGMSDEETELTVESLHKTDGHPPTFGRGN